MDRRHAEPIYPAAAAALNDARPTTGIFLTGGSGYVGRNLIRTFVAQGVPVRALAGSAAAEQRIAGLGASSP